MNLKNLLAKFTLLLALMILTVGTSFGQGHTFYVRNDAQGDDLTAVVDNPLKPYKTILAAVTAAADGDIISLACMTYTEAQVTLDKNLTVVSTVDNALTVATIDNGFVINDAVGVNLGRTADGSQGFLLKDGGGGALVLTKGVLSITSANVEINDAAGIFRSAGSISAAPVFGANTSVTYTGTSNIATGYELPNDLGVGVLTSTLGATETLTVGHAVSVGAIDNGAGKMNFSGNVTVVGEGTGADDVINAGTIILNSNIMTLDGNTNDVYFNNTGKIVSLTTLTVGGASIKTAGDGTGNFLLNGEIPSLNIPSGVESKAVANDPLTIVGTLTLSSAIAGTFDENSQTITVYGNFARLNNTAGNYIADGTLVMKGKADQTFNPGLQLQFNDVTIDNDAGTTVTMTQALDINGAFTIAAGAKLNHGNFNILIDVAGTTFTDNGEYYTTGNGLLIIDHAGTTTLTGTGIFSNIDVRTTATVLLGSDIDMAGVLTFRDGTTLDFNAFGPYDITLISATYATIPTVNWYFNAAQDNPGAFLLDTGVKYNLNYYTNGADPAGVEFVGSGINNLTIAKGAANGNITAPAEVTNIYGVLTVAKDQTFTLAADVNLMTASKTHVISGTVAKGAAEVFVVKETGVAINGGTATGTQAVSVGITIDIATGETFSSSSLKAINGNVIAELGTSSITLLATSGTHTGNITVNGGKLTYTPGAGTLTGNVILNDGEFVIGGNLIVTGTTSHIDGAILNLGSKSYEARGAYDLSTSASTGVFTGTGKVVFNANLTLTPFADGSTKFGNVELKANTLTVANPFEITGTYTQTNGTLALGANNLTFSGTTYKNVAGSQTAAGGGIVIFTGTAVKLTGNQSPTFVNAEVNTTGSVTIDPTDAATPVARTITFSGTLTIVKGTLAQGINHISLTLVAGADAFDRQDGTVTASSGKFTFAGAGVQTFNTTIDGFDFPNLVIATGATANTVTSDDFEISVSKTLTLTSGTLTMTAGQLTLNDGVVVTVQSDGNGVGAIISGALSSIPVFPDAAAGKYISLVYKPEDNSDGATEGQITAGNEWPTGNKLMDLTVASVDGANDYKALGQFALKMPAANQTVYGTLTANDRIDVSGKKITMNANATLVLNAVQGTDIFAAAADIVMGNPINLKYTGGADITTTATEFNPTDDVIGLLTIDVDATKKVILAAALADTPVLTGELLFTDAGGDLDINDNDLTLEGNLTQETGAGFIIDGGAATLNNLTFAGANNQVVTLKNNWIVPKPSDNGYQIAIGKSDNTKSVTINGKNLDFANTAVYSNTLATDMAILYLNKGLLNTSATTYILLAQGDDGLGSPIQGFERPDDGAFIIGNVRKFIRNDVSDPIVDFVKENVLRSTVIFPTGAETSAGYFRPATFFFTNNPQSSFNLTVNHDNTNPGGTNGILPNGLNGGSGVVITNYPDFKWFVKSDVQISPSYKFDVEFQAEGYAFYEFNEIQDMRLIRRDSGNVGNQWRLQGTGVGDYDNSTINDTWPVVKVTNATGGLTMQGAIFAYSQSSKAPTVSSPANVAVNENVAMTPIVWTVTDSDLGQVPTNTVAWTTTAPVVAPTAGTGAGQYQFDAATATLTWTPTFDQSGVYVVTITATDPLGLTTTDAVTITVANIDRNPLFDTTTETLNLANDSGAIGTAKTLTYHATDPDADVVTYAYTVTPTPSTGSVVFSATAGTIVFTPDFADIANSPFTFVVTGQSVTTPILYTLTPVTTVFTVGHSATKGDVNLLGGPPDGDDALLVLNYLVNPAVYPLTPEQLWAADVSGNDGVNAYDAASILYYVVNGTFLAKQTAVAGTVEFGKFTSEKNIITLPINLSNTTGVRSFYSEIQLGSSVEFTGVSSRLPEGWIMASNFVNGTLKIAMVGLTPLTDGDLAFVNLSIKDKEAKVSVQGNVALNGQPAGALNAVQIKEIPSEFALSQNYPNPFNPTTSIKYGIPENSRVNLVVYNILGQAVRTLVNAEQESGYYTVRWDGTNDFGSRVSSGIYIYRISAGNFTSTIKMNLLK